MAEIFNLVKHLIWHRKISFHCEINTSKQCNFNARCQLAYPKQFYSSYQKQKKKSVLVFLKTQKLLVPVVYQRERTEVKILLDYVQAFGKSTSLFRSAGAWGAAPLQNGGDSEHPAHQMSWSTRWTNRKPALPRKEECPCHREDN